MSSIHSEVHPTAPSLLADGLIDEASKLQSGRRMFMTAYLGVALELLLDELLRRADGDASIESERGPVGLRTVRAGERFLIPYLVGSDPAAGTNRGSEGFAARLRSEFSDGDDGRVLLLLGNDLVETIVTAATDAASLPALDWERLCTAATAAARPALRGVVEKVAEEVGRRSGVPSAAALERLARFVATRWESGREAGDHLYDAGPFLRDPNVEQAPGQRLKDAAGLRVKIEEWSAPGQDLEARLLRRLGGRQEAVQKVARAVIPGGIDWSRFTLDDLLPGTSATRFAFRRPLDVSGGAAHVLSGSSMALWLDGPGREVELALAAPAPEAAAVELMGSRGLMHASGIDRGSGHVRVDLRSMADGWTFATLALLVEGDTIDRVRLAVCARTGSWFPIERSLAVDVSEQAFIVEEDDPLVLAVAPGGGILGPIPVRDELPTGVTVDLRVSRERQEQTIPVLLLGGDVEEEPPDDEDGAARLAAPSPLHALLRAAADSPDRTADELAMSFRVAEGEPYLTVAGELEDIQAQDVAGIDGFALEREILARARTWAFVATRAQDSIAVHADAELERLSLGTLPAQQVEGFQQARERFFAAIAEYGSVYALGADEARGEALAYVQAYADLLGTLPNDGRYEPEYDRVLLVDQVAVGDGDERYFAPTNPVSVAFYLAFAAAVERWLPRASELAPADLESVSPHYLLPLVHARGEWYEAAPGEAFLWRRHQALATNPTDLKQDARFISDRLEFFLDVFPAYAATPAGGSNPHALSVSVVGDDDGQALVAGLERFYRKDLRGEKYAAPRLEIALVNDGAQVPAAVRRLIAGEGGDGEGGARRAEDLRRLVRSRVTFSALGELPTFSHLTFALRTPAEESPAQVDMRERASTAFVGGLATIPGRAASLGANLRTFSWGAFTQHSDRPPTGSPPEAMLAFVSRRCLELVGGQPRGLLRSGVTTMRTTAVEPDFMPEAYASSVWVVHLDRLLGLEAFASTGDVPERYLVEYGESPELGGAGLEGVTATKRVDPYHNALTQALSDLGTLRGAGLQRILRLLNSVHGRWALQLLRQSTEKVRERIGTVAAIAVLEELDRAFHGPDGSGVLIPLDELFEQVPGARPPGRNSSVTDDLLFVHIAGGEMPHLSARLIEVKYRTKGRPPLGGARQQVENTQEHLERLLTGDGPGQLFRARDVAQLIRNSRARALAFGLVAAEDDPDLEHALEQVAAGHYTLSFEYSVGAERLIGDVISVEYDTDVAALRGDLPGAGRPAGLIRVGRPALQALAAGRPLPTGSQAWERPDFRRGGAADDGPPARPVKHPPDAPDDDVAVEEDGMPPPFEDRDARAEIETLARALDAAALKYELELEPFRPDLAQVGPSVIRFRARPLGRQSLRGVAGHAADLAREIGVSGEVLVAQEPYYITVDVPRRERQVVEYGAHLGSLQPTAPGSLDFLVGVAPSGDVVTADLARLPHLLIAGATDSGKSVFLRSLLCSLLEYRSPSELSVLLVDPKQVDFIPFEDLPHLVGRRIITDPAEAVTTLAETIGSELDRRRPLLKRAGVTSALEFYEAGGTLGELPQMVVIVDEFADLAATLDRVERAEFMTVIQRYGQLTRAFGIYLVLATQRPSVQVITGEIKANLTARVAMKLQSSADSVTILGHKGAESLSARGDLLFEHGGEQQRLQGLLVRPADVARVVQRWTNQSRAS